MMRKTEFFRIITIDIMALQSVYSVILLILFLPCSGSGADFPFGYYLLHNDIAGTGIYNDRVRFIIFHFTESQ